MAVFSTVALATPSLTRTWKVASTEASGATEPTFQVRLPPSLAKKSPSAACPATVRLALPSTSSAPAGTTSPTTTFSASTVPVLVQETL